MYYVRKQWNVQCNVGDICLDRLKRDSLRVLLFVCQKSKGGHGGAPNYWNSVIVGRVFTFVSLVFNSSLSFLSRFEIVWFSVIVAQFCDFSEAYIFI